LVGVNAAAATVFSVNPAEAGLRIDAFLVGRSVAVSAAAARRLLAETTVLVDGRRGRKGDRLTPGQTVEVLPAGGRRREDASFEAVPPLVVLHEDDALVVLDKPAGIACHPLRDGEGVTLATALLARYPECAGASDDPREAGFAHRLDIGTSGVIVAARSAVVHRALRTFLGGGGSVKQYLAEVVGVPAGQGVTVVDMPIGRQGRRGARVVLGGGRGALPARTEVRLRAAGADTALVEATLTAGRAHQVRAHLAHLGTPILGDRLYGDSAAQALADARGVAGFRLHAWRLRLVHPTTGATMEFEAPLPAWAMRHDRQESR
jgi:23S rRNA pseudouridine1911/1915/1917 synthase